MLGDKKSLDNLCGAAVTAIKLRLSCYTMTPITRIPFLLFLSVFPWIERQLQCIFDRNAAYLEVIVVAASPHECVICTVKLPPEDE
jgi:hypothetical protein